MNTDTWIKIVAVAIVAGFFAWIFLGSKPTAIPDSESTSPTSTPTTTKKPTGNGAPTLVQDNDVVSIVTNLKGVSQFKSYFTSTGVAASIQRTSGLKYTVFIPTDESIAELAKGTITNLDAAGKKRLMQYHVISGRAVDVGAQISGQLQALSGDMLNFNIAPNQQPTVNSAGIVATYRGTNGIVYVIDAVLLPPRY